MTYCPKDGYPMRPSRAKGSRPPVCTNPAHPRTPDCPNCKDRGPHTVGADGWLLCGARCGHSWHAGRR